MTPEEGLKIGLANLFRTEEYSDIVALVTSFLLLHDIDIDLFQSSLLATKMTTSTSMTPEEGLKIGLANLFRTEEYSDFTIKCGPYEFKVHRSVVCQQSEYFKAACRSNSFKEGETRLIILDTSDENDPASDDPEAVKQMIHFLYHMDYAVERVGEESVQQANAMANGSAHKKKKAYNSYQQVVTPAAVEPTGTPYDGNALAHARIFAAAVKYHVVALQAMAVAKFKAAIQSNSDRTSLAQTVTTVYTTTPDDVRELRDIVAETLTKDSSLLSRSDVRTAVCNLNGLSFDLLRGILDSAHKCSSCGGTGSVQSGNSWYCYPCYN
ncbi:unnamed protein product [Zymoseptoria tritici ST99CH_1A5]|uniref:BTB domain-containing protein n=1 Tax=Zymoseptoria tritici ST99CH_1A5 TaxID=1276529 RepID=A0A1Y6LKC7_ZYMTR|nr:unnamed protein product [Zymoseptoria tritici ST99CH_1A5]